MAWQALPLLASALSSKPVALSCARLFQLLFGMLPLPAPCSTHGLAFPVPGLSNRSRISRNSNNREGGPNKTNRCVEEPREDIVKTQHVLKDSCAEVSILPSPVNGVCPEIGTTSFGRQALHLHLFLSLVLIFSFRQAPDGRNKRNFLEMNCLCDKCPRQISKMNLPALLYGRTSKRPNSVLCAPSLRKK